MGFLDHDVDHTDAVTRGHGEVRDGSEGGDERSEDMEKALLLHTINTRRLDEAPG